MILLILLIFFLLLNLLIDELIPLNLLILLNLLVLLNLWILCIFLTFGETQTGVHTSRIDTPKMLIEFIAVMLIQLVITQPTDFAQTVILRNPIEQRVRVTNV